MSVLFLVHNTLVKKKNSTVIGMFKYNLAQRFSNSGISRTPKLPQIRPGRDPFLIRLFSRLPYLIRFLSLDVLLKKLYETHDQISHTFCYLWLELYSQLYFFFLSVDHT